MIDEKFQEVMRSNTGCAVIMAGSDSDDKPRGVDPSHIENIAASLQAFGIPYEVRVCSAHKQNEKLGKIVKEYNSVGGLVAYVSVAGGVDALSGELSFNVLGPVISCPPDSNPPNHNESCLNNPPGSSNAYIARPANVGRFIAQMYSGVNPKFRELIAILNTKKRLSLEEADEKIQTKYREKQKQND